MRRFGGRLRREARRSGRRLRLENGTRLLSVSSCRRPNVTRAAILVTGPSNGALGTPGPPQGAEFIRQELPSARSDSDVGSAAGCPVRGSCDPQQQDSPRHFVSHLHWCGATLGSRAEDTEVAHPSCAQLSATNSTANDSKQRGRSIRVTRLADLTQSAALKNFGYCSRPASTSSTKYTLRREIACQGPPLINPPYQQRAQPVTAGARPRAAGSRRSHHYAGTCCSTVRRLRP